MSNKIFITGGAGYVGSRMVDYFLSEGKRVTVYDTCFFGNEHLPKSNPNFNLIENDIRDLDKLYSASKNHDIFIHLACISNDASFALDENLSKTINYDCFEDIVLIAKKNNYKKFIYASSSSVYGVSTKKNVTEDHELVPLTLYNKYKGMCEPILNKHLNDDFIGVTFRPATVCGYSPRMRFDLSVNILTNHGYSNKKILVFGGDQLRPNLHIQDYINFVDLLINADSKKINKEVFNVGYENLSIMNIAKTVKNVINKNYFSDKIEIQVEPSDDPRSYHIDSSKSKRVLNFDPKYDISFAINEICSHLKDNSFGDTFNSKYFNVKHLLNNKIA